MRRRIIEWVFVLVALASVAGQVAAQGSSPSSRTSVTDTVHVAPPTGETETDRASILAALDEVQPGGTVRFAPGTYLIGEIIHVTVPGISLVGHPDGTTLRGCDPDIFPRHGGLEEIFVAVVSCNGFDMAGGHQTVRALTFEYAWHALVLGGMECVEGRGCVPVLEPVGTRLGGYLVRGNTFRNSANGVRTIGEWTEPAVIRENRFVNTFHAAEVHGSTVHFLDNDISVPEPEHVPSSGHPGGAVGLSATDLNGELALRCAGNIIAGNRIEGHPDGISIALLRPGTSCHDNVVQDNTIRVARVRVAASSWAGVTLTDADSSVVGVPLALVGSPEAYDLPISVENTGQEGRLVGNLIKGNHIQGAEGLGMELYRASGNRIVDNIIEDLQQRTPYPGLTVNSTNPEKAGWRDANGAGIWLSPGSDENEILGNTFEDIAGAAVFLDGDDNRVEIRTAGDVVRDLGTGNQISVADGGPGHGPSMGQAVLGDSALADTLLSLTDDLAASWTRLEPDDYLDRFSDDLVFYFEGSRVSRSEFAAVVRGTMEALTESTFEVSDPDVEILGPDAAVVSFGLREVMVDRNGDVTDLRGTLTLVWERREGEWRVVRAHESLPPADDGGR